MLRPFTKAPTTYAQQIALLRSRGMTVEDDTSASFYLQHLNYYRLCAYWLPFEADHATHQFQPGTSFAAVVNLYVFDRELRLLILDAIERIEVSVRSQWAYQLAHRHGPHAHLNRAIHDPLYWTEIRDHLQDEVNRSDEVFIKHMRDTYQEDLPPVWAVAEVMSLGLLSRWYSNLQPMPTRRAIADAYDVDEMVLQSWLRHLALIRNTCAHHSRLWNRSFPITPMRPQKRPSALPSEFQTGSRKLYNTLLILVHFMDIISPSHHWRQRLKALVTKHTPPLRAMGFPENWLERPIWNTEVSA